jgi:hypothetical protein
MESRDPHAGLFGAILITSADMANDDGTPKDVDREYVLTFAILDEGHSFLLEKNMQTYLPKVRLVGRRAPVPVRLPQAIHAH